MLDTKFTVKQITRAGLITVGFSKALRVPVDANGKENFKEVDSLNAFVVFEKKSENEDVIEFTYELLEWDRNGLWCTFQLRFGNPLYVSLGEFPDKVHIYLSKEFFLWQWFFVEDRTKKYCYYNCEEKEAARRRLSRDLNTFDLQ